MNKIILAIVVLLATPAWAQSETWDVVTTTDGMEYRGVVTDSGDENTIKVLLEVGGEVLVNKEDVVSVKKETGSAAPVKPTATYQEPPTHLPSTEKRNGLVASLQIGAAIPTGEWNDDYAKASFGIGVGGRYEMHLGRNLSIGVGGELDFHNWSARTDLTFPDGTPIEIVGTARTIGVMATGRATLHLGKFTPYVFAGVGADINIVDDETEFNGMIIGGKDSKVGLAFEFGPGANFELTEKLAIGAQITIHPAINQILDRTGSPKLGYAGVSGGLSYRF